MTGQAPRFLWGSCRLGKWMICSLLLDLSLALGWLGSDLCGGFKRKQKLTLYPPNAAPRHKKSPKGPPRLEHRECHHSRAQQLQCKLALAGPRSIEFATRERIQRRLAPRLAWRIFRKGMLQFRFLGTPEGTAGGGGGKENPNFFWVVVACFAFRVALVKTQISL